jgi:uncharacterized protein (DUF488 family)
VGPAAPALLTFGHGRADQQVLTDLLRGAGVESVIDIRRFPGSRTNPQVSRQALACWLPGSGISYRWEERLGGRRQLPRGVDSPDSWWTVAAFRAYAAHTRTAAFTEALPPLLEQLLQRRTAVMCSETVWWRCHRRLVADVALLGHGVPVLHLMPGGQQRPHQLSAGARLAGDGLLVWDG